MRDCTRYTINAALHVVTCILMDAEGDMTIEERIKSADTTKLLAQLRKEWADPRDAGVMTNGKDVPEMARRNG